MTEIQGPRFGGVHPIPSEEEMKKMRLKAIKTKAGQIAHLLILGREAAASSIKQGISYAEGALKRISNRIKDKMQGEE